jgi:hypothetical protein
MKKIATMLAVVALGVLSIQAQGLIVADNQGNTGNSTATTSGLFYLNNGVTTSLLTTPTLNLAIYGGSSAGSMTLLATFSGANALFAGGNAGEYYDFMQGLSIVVPGVALSGTATLQLYAWTGAFTSYASAVTGGAATAVSAAFTNPTGGGGSPPSLPAVLSGMPSMVLAVPEPATIALMGLGAASLLIFRRRK